MERRSFLKTLLGLPLLIPPKGMFPRLKSKRNKKDILIQKSPIAGFQYYEGERLWKKLSIGDMVQLNREPDNPYDKKAVEICWRGIKLGYLPRVENTAVTQMMDQGQEITARISDKKKSWNPWERLIVEVWIQV